MTIPPERLALIHQLAERNLSPDEFEAYVRAPVTPYEREEQDRLIQWFVARYPNPAARLRYARRAYARWALAARSRSA